MVHVAKGYDVRKRTGSTAIYRGGKHVGEHPTCGYQVVIHGRCTRLAGTALAAHALAEVELDVQPHRRKFVLSSDEYDEHVAALQDNLDALIERFPFSPDEAKQVNASNSRYASVIEAGRETIRRALMNVSPYEYVVWNPRPVKRPDIADSNAMSPGASL